MPTEKRADAGSLEKLIALAGLSTNGAMTSSELQALQQEANAPVLTMTSRLAMLPVRHPCAVLLFVQILGILLYPLMEDTSAGRALFGLIGLLVLGAALYVVKRGPWLTGFGVALALPVVVLSIWLAFDFDPRTMLIMTAFEAMFYFYAAGSLIAYMLEDDFATLDELFAAGATFTLLAWAFAYLYVLCQALLPGSFGAIAGASNPRTWIELLFLSFTTLSSVGLGDIIPLLPMARALVMIEQFAGVMYLALVVSRLIALSVIKRTER